MGLAESSKSRIYIGRTATKGTPPTTYQLITPTGHSLEPNAQSFESEDIDPSGLAIDKFRHTLSGAGDMSYHWRPTIYDDILQALMHSTFTAALNLTTLTVSFGAPNALGIQRITDDGVNGFLTDITAGRLKAGVLVTVGGAVANALNAGLKMVVAVDAGGDYIDVYNPLGAASPADAGVTFVHAGTMGLGTVASWVWIERMQNDGVIDIYSEWFKDALVGNWQMSFPASAPTRCSFNFDGLYPTFVHNDGGAGITKQRGGTDVAASTDRLVHGMDDVREIIFYSLSANRTIRLDEMCSLFECTLGRNIRKDAAVGTSQVINTSPGRPDLGGRVNAFMNSSLSQTSHIMDLFSSYPDDLAAWVIYGAQDTDAYGIYYSTVRVQASAAPVGGNDQAVQINAQFSGRNAQVTRL
jgi:hypothetical protein